jgi:diguanylate cyclase (GGDEF)-like protein
MCRVGGEEFIFTLNNINWENAVKTNERIRAKVERNLKNFDNIDIGLTCSMGMVFVDYEQMKSINPSDKADKKKMKELANQIIKEADDYMYISKNSGRNRVTVVKYKSEKDKDIEEK